MCVPVKTAFGRYLCFYFCEPNSWLLFFDIGTPHHLTNKTLVVNVLHKHIVYKVLFQISYTFLETAIPDVS